jgi:hypothetical protein
MALLTNSTTAIGGVLNGSYKELKDIPSSLQGLINTFDGLVLIRETLTPTRTTGTLWYKGQVLGLTVEDVVRKKKIDATTAIPDSSPGIGTFNPLTAKSYNITLDITGKASLERCYVKFPNDTRAKFRSPGVFPRVGTDPSAAAFSFDGLSFGGIRIHNGSDENWSEGCIIFSRTRNLNGTLKNDLPGAHLLTQWMYNNLGFSLGKNTAQIIVINEFEFPKDPPKTETTGVIIDQTTNLPIKGVEIQLISPSAQSIKETVTFSPPTIMDNSTYTLSSPLSN